MKRVSFADSGLTSRMLGSQSAPSLVVAGLLLEPSTAEGHAATEPSIIVEIAAQL